jgi:hypothetical protein
MHHITRLTTLALVAAGVLAAPTATALAASSPSVTATSPTHIGQTSAQFNGTVNPNGAATSYVFQYGLTNGYGLNTAVKNAGHGTKVVKVSAKASQLIPGTVYHFRIVAYNAHGAAVGRDHTFTTVGPPPPAAATGPAFGVGVNKATITGIINPNGAVTSYQFQYGETTSYGVSTDVLNVPSGTTPVTVWANLGGLQQFHLFHYRIVAYHMVGPPTYGADAVFMTEPSTKFTPGIRASTSPHRARHRPFVFTTSGHISGPAPAFDCNGQVAVRVFFGKRAISRVLVPVASNCTFTAQTPLNRKPGHGARNRRVTLKVLVYFRGNGYLKPRFAKSQTVTVG